MVTRKQLRDAIDAATKAAFHNGQMGGRPEAERIAAREADVAAFIETLRLIEQLPIPSGETMSPPLDLDGIPVDPAELTQCEACQ